MKTADDDAIVSTIRAKERVRHLQGDTPPSVKAPRLQFVKYPLACGGMFRLGDKPLCEKTLKAAEAHSHTLTPHLFPRSPFPIAGIAATAWRSASSFSW